MALDGIMTMFNPQSIAIIGASDKPHSVGAIVVNNLINGGYKNPIYPVNPKYKAIQGIPAFSSVKEIPLSVDLAVILTPAQITPDILKQCAAKGIQHVVIISAGFKESGVDGIALENQIKDIAVKHHIRILGPNCLGMILPHQNVNISFSHSIAVPGNIGLISQSGAICASILDWAKTEKIGFSGIFSIGNAADLDFGDILEYLALDHHTKSILLYIESVQNAHHFMKGLRIATSKKPVIVIKAGREGGSKAAMSHTGALIGYDDVYDCAFKRAGAVRVTTIEQLFNAAEILSKVSHVDGNRLAIVTNGGGAGVMAADQMPRSKVTLATLNDNTISELNSLLPKYWSHQNPVDILGDAQPKRYYDAIKACLSDSNVDGVLVMLTPVAMSQPNEVAKEIISLAKTSKKTILTCWLGGEQVTSARKLFSDNNIASFNTPEEAVDAFSYLCNHHQNQNLLMQVPQPIISQTKSDILGSKKIIEFSLSENRKILTSIESKTILNAFGIPTLIPIEANTAQEAISAAEALGFPVVMKINSKDISHKQDVGGVKVNLKNAQEILSCFDKMIASVQKIRPDATILGVTIEGMRKEPHDRELMIGVFRDPTFGPVISFGFGGILVEVIKDRALAFPPLTQEIAQNMIKETKISKALGDFRNMPKVNIEAITDILLKTSEMVCELPQINEMDINPLIVNENSAIAVDARIVVDFDLPSLSHYNHMAIHP